jgi:hypothetical protein
MQRKGRECNPDKEHCHVGLEAWLKMKNACFVSTKPRVQTPVPTSLPHPNIIMFSSLVRRISQGE